MDATEQVAKASEFFNTDEGMDGIQNALNKGKDHVIVDFFELASFNIDLAEELLDDPENVLQAMSHALQVGPYGLKQGITIRVKNVSKTTMKDIHKIRKDHEGLFITIEGVVKQKSSVKGQVISIRYECGMCGNIIPVLQPDEHQVRKPSICAKCAAKSRFRPIHEEKVDVFSMMLEEIPQINASNNKLETVKVLARAGLANSSVERKIYQGVKVRITGILKNKKRIINGKTSNLIDWYLEANYVEMLEDSFADMSYTKEDVKQFHKLAKRDELLDLFSEHIFYDIYGYKEEKEGIILQLFSGSNKSTRFSSIRGNSHILLVGDAGCVGEGTLVTLADGTFKRIESFKDDYKLILLNRSSHEPKKGIVSDFFRYENQFTKIITLQTGKKIVCTYEHPLLVRGKSSFQKLKPFEWRRAADLRVGDKVKVIPKITNNRKKYVELNPVDVPKNGKRSTISVCNENVAKIAGYVLGDGWVHKTDGKTYYRTSLIINQEEADLVSLFKELFIKEFDVDPKIRTRTNNAPAIIDGRVLNRTQPVNILSVNRKDPASIFKKNENHGVYDFILSSPKSVVASFLSGLFEADGCVFVAKTKDRCDKGAISLKCSYERLRQDVLVLLLQFGIKARIVGDDVNIKRTDDVVTFIKEIGFLSEKKKKRSEEVLAVCNKIPHVHKHNKNHFSEKIISIEEGPQQTVYDITVDKYHRFITNGVVSHNTAKSSMLKAIHKFSPKARYVAGTGVSAVGLTGAAVKDELLGGWTVEAGAIPLSSGGILCLDELDKVSEENKKALHEPLEEQTVSIDKGGVHVTLPAHTSVLAAANPKYGKYSLQDTFYSQIELPIPLFSRFDLIYVIRSDVLTEDYQRHVLKKIIHRGSKKYEEEAESLEFEREFLLKYISYAKQFEPEMTEDAAQFIEDKWMQLTEFQKKNADRTDIVSLNPRHADAITRLAKNITRMHLEKYVSYRFAELAYEKIMYSVRMLGVEPGSGNELEEFAMKGQPKKVVSKVDFMTRIIKVLREHHVQNKVGMKFSELCAVLSSEGYDDVDKIETYLDKLKHNGDVFEPKNDSWQVALRR